MSVLISDSNNVGMKNKCCVNVKVYFEIACVHVRVQPYPPFPLTHDTWYYLQMTHEMSLLQIKMNPGASLFHPRAT